MKCEVPCIMAATIIVGLCGCVSSLTSNDPMERQRAVADVSDNAALLKIAVNDADANVRYAAAGRIRDLDALRNISDNDEKKNTHSRMKLIVLLRRVLAESEILRRPVWISLWVGELSWPYKDSRDGRTVVVRGEKVEIAIMDGPRTVLAHDTLTTDFAANLAIWELDSLDPFIPAAPLNPVFPANTATSCIGGIVVDLCRAEHCAPAQIRAALAKVAVRDRDPLAWESALCSIQDFNGDSGRRVNFDFTNYHTAVIAAAGAGAVDTLELLLANGGDVNSTDGAGGAPLLAAAGYSGSTEVCAMLIASGADVNVKGGMGLTPLHVAASCGRKDVAELLVAKGADVNAKDEQGSTALSLAVQAGHSDIADLLRMHGGHE